MKTARVTSKGQVTVPSDIRKALGIERGDHLAFEVVREDEAAVRVLKARKLSSLYGALPAKRAFPGKDPIRKAVGRALAGEDPESDPGISSR
jgi:AbrB family looped-hinge helix DNA binding protein